MVFLPSKLEFGVAGPVLTSIDFRNRPLLEPFFKDELNLIPDDSKMRTQQLNLEEYQLSNLQPDLIIFHVGRCGSTLLANMLRHIPGAIVVSEAQPISACLMPPSSKNWPYPLRYWDEYRQRLLDVVASSYLAATPKTAGPSKLILKLSSWNIVGLSLIKKLWPSTKCIFLDRAKEEVLSSLLNTPPGLIWFKDNVSLASSVFKFRVPTTALPDREFYLHMIGLFQNLATENSIETYKILDDIVGSFENLTSQLSWNVSSNIRADALEELSFYSKNKKIKMGTN